MAQIESTFPLRFPPDLGHKLAVALHEPDIPLNAGSVARTCACTGVPLHIVGTPGFILDNKLAKRAGLDYWEHAEIAIHKTWSDFEAVMEGRRMWLFSTKGSKVFWDADFRSGDVLVFGSELAGLPESILKSRPDNVLVLPMIPDRRSLNLSNTVAAGLYHALGKVISEPAGSGSR